MKIRATEAAVLLEESMPSVGVDVERRVGLLLQHLKKYGLKEEGEEKGWSESAEQSGDGDSTGGCGGAEIGTAFV